MPDLVQQRPVIPFTALELAGIFSVTFRDHPGILCAAGDVRPPGNLAEARVMARVKTPRGIGERNGQHGC